MKTAFFSLLLAVIPALVSAQKNNLTSNKLYVLTNNDRKFYTLTVEQNKISTPVKAVKYVKNVKAFKVPVILNNKSNHPLMFYTMYCSWMMDFGVNTENIFVQPSNCDSNTPDIITVPAHGSFVRIITLCYYSNKVKSGYKFKFRFNLNIANSKPHFDLYQAHTNTVNNIWSNEISVP